VNKTLIATVAALMVSPPVALVTVGAITAGTSSGSGATVCTITAPIDPDTDGPVAAETARVVFPLPAGTWTRTSRFGWRTDPIAGDRRFHAGSDFAAPDGTPIVSVTDGIVLYAGRMDGFGNVIIITSTVDGAPVVFFYGHEWDSGIHVTTGQAVTAGQHIGDVGANGHATGPHLHLEVHPGGRNAPPVNADTWLTTHNAEGITDVNLAPPGQTLCTPDGGGRA
jgi:murein DD-endopeptidase MepM/ murein hydrolase activator NlpD